MPGLPRSLAVRVLAILSALAGLAESRPGHGAGMVRRRCWGAALAVVALLWVSTASTALALHLVVDTPLDSAAANLQACTAAPGDCSLRGAIVRANAEVGAHTITLPDITLTISIVGSNEDNGFTGDLDILSNITINGVSPSATVITWDESIALTSRDRIFHVHPTGRLTVRDLSLRRGGAGTSVTSSVGGGIWAQGPLTVERVSIRLSEASAGGGLSVSDTTVVRDSAIVLNAALLGGGIHVVDSTSPFTVSIENTTISSNVGNSGAGGLAVIANLSNTVVTLNNATVAANQAPAADGLTYIGVGSLVLRNTIVANSSAASSPNCEGTVISQGHNLVFGGGTCGMSVGNGDIVNTGDPLLGPLQDNGGPTVTHALAPGSAALDRGNPAPPGSGGTACTATDQRGTGRPIDGDGMSGPRCDIGAFEAPAPSLTFIIQPGGAQAGTPLTPQPAVLVLNSQGQPLSGFTGPVTLAFGANPGGGTLDGPVTVNAVNGLATFAGLSVSAAGTPYTLVASSPGLTSATSAPFTITAPPPSSCSPRPNVRVTTAAAGSGQLNATISAQSSALLPNNSLSSVSITRADNAAVRVNGTPVAVGATVTLPAGTTQVTLQVIRQSPGQNPAQASTVSFSASDACGEWKSFVGGGPGAF